MAENTKDILILILARHYGAGISIARSLGPCGYTVDMISNSTRKDKYGIAAACRYVRNCTEVITPKIDSDADEKIVNALLKYGSEHIDETGNREKIVLFPVDDFTTAVMDRNRSRLEAFFDMPSVENGIDGSMVELMDKTVQSRIAAEAGLDVPEEWAISLAGDIVVPDEITYPCFCKPIESFMGFKVELAKCENREALLRHLNWLKSRHADRSVLVQQFLNIEDEIDLSGLCVGDKVIIPAIIRKTAVSEHEKGVTMAGVISPCDGLGDVYDKAVNMLRSIRYTGMFDMEFNIADGKLYFNELNLRCGGPNYSYYASGVNLPDLLVKSMKGIACTPEEEKVSEFGKSFVYDKVAWEDYLNGYISKKKLNDLLAKSDLALLASEDDSEPGRQFLKQVKDQMTKQKKQKIKSLYLPALKKTKSLMRHYPQNRASNRRNPDSETARVIVMGRNYASNLSMARSLGRAGYEVEVLRLYIKRPKKNDFLERVFPDAYSRYVKAYHECVTNRKSQPVVDKLIEIADENRKMLLIPVDDISAAIIDEHYELLKQHYVTQNIHGRAGEINRLMSKKLQLQMAEAAGLEVAGQGIISTINGDFDIPSGIEYPCFVKPDVSRLHPKFIMKKCDSEEELRDHITSITREKDRTMLVEKYLEISKEYSLLGVSDGKNANGPALFTVTEEGKEERKGIAIAGRTLDTRPMKDFIDKLVSFVESLDFQGLYDIDFVETEDGQLYFVEINMRFGASGQAFAQAGVNLPGMYADFMLKGIPIDKKCVLKETGKIFVNEKELLHELAGGRITGSEMEQMIDEADITFIRNEEDSRPYKYFRKQSRKHFGE